jgi:hypothetical protein
MHYKNKGELPTMSTQAKSINVLELLSGDFPDGQKAKITTDNELYGTTVVRKKDSLYNARTGKAIPTTSLLLQSKFKLISDEIEISLSELVPAYKNGNTIKIQIGDSHRLIKKENMPEIQELLERISGALPFGQVRTDNEIITLEELEFGKFFLINK